MDLTVPTWLMLMLASATLLGSPGPTPITLAAYGSVYGVKKSLPFFCGIITGLCLVTLSCMLGLVGLFQTVPMLKPVLLLLSSIYILFLATKILQSSFLAASSENVPGFKWGILFNLINPKAYFAIVALFAQFIPEPQSNTELTMASLIIVATGLMVDAIWLILGTGLSQVIKQKERFLRVGFTSALFLLVSINFYNEFIH